MHYKIPLIFAPQPEGGYTVTSPLLPELITEGDSVDDAIDNVRDALAAVIEAYEETGRTLPPGLFALDQNKSLSQNRQAGGTPTPQCRFWDRL